MLYWEAQIDIFQLLNNSQQLLQQLVMKWIHNTSVATTFGQLCVRQLPQMCPHCNLHPDTTENILRCPSRWKHDSNGKLEMNGELWKQVNSISHPLQAS